MSDQDAVQVDSQLEPAQGEAGSQIEHPRSPIPGLNGGTLTPFTSSRASEAANRRWELHRLAAEQGAAEGAGTVDHFLARRAIVREQTRVAISGVRGSAASAAYVDRALGAVEPARHSDDDLGGAAAVLKLDHTAIASISGAVAEAMVAMAERRSAEKG